MVLAAAVYAEQLSHRGHGIPLWIPEPSRFGQAEIGDVGYIHNGGFYRLFNVTYPEDHLINRDGVPSNFSTLNIVPGLLHEIERSLHPGALCSRSVRNTYANVGGSLDVAAAGASYRFTCSENQGALLVLKDYATRQEVHDNKIFRDYMRRHHESWHYFATENRGLTLKPEDIILVKGWVKTTEWAVAAFLDKGTAHEISFQAGYGPYAKADFSVSVAEHVSESVEYRSSLTPSQSPGGVSESPPVPRDQCVFLSAYKVKRRGPFGWRIVASAGYSKDGRPRSPTNDHSVRATSLDSDVSQCTVDEDSSKTPFRDPLDDVLEYILENSEAESAIASHCCLAHIQALADSLDLGNHEISDILRSIRPMIVLDDTHTGTLDTDALMNGISIPTPSADMARYTYQSGVEKSELLPPSPPELFPSAQDAGGAQDCLYSHDPQRTSRSAGRGGCWTCRVRRKKCDGEHIEGDSCKTCQRLSIHCLGWSARRPEWMKDKEKIAMYKGQIKSELSRAGYIRGQPLPDSDAAVLTAAGPSTSFPERYPSPA